MLMPIFVLGLGVYFLISWVLLLFLKPENPKKAWHLLSAVAVFVCTADHVMGYVYARTWVLLARGNPGMQVKSDSILLVFDNTTEKTPDDAGYWVEPFVEMVSHGYKKIEVIQRHRLDRPSKRLQTFELRVVREDFVPGCDLFKNMDTRVKTSLLAMAEKEIVDGGKARCISVNPIDRVSAHYSIERISNKLPLSNALGIASSYRVSAINLKTQSTLSEYRSLRFEGGWVKRTFWTELDSGKTNWTTFRSRPFERTDWDGLKHWFDNLYRPATFQRLDS